MNWTQTIIVYGVTWWMLLFMALPIGVANKPAQANELNTGAPAKTHLKIKCLWVTILAVLVTWGIDLLIHSGIVAVK